jgi:hypothetical protein
MELTQIYAILVGAILIVLLLCSCAASVHRHIRLLDRCTRRTFRWLIRPFRILAKSAAFRWSQLLLYPDVVGRHRYLGPWRPVDFIHPVLYLSINSFCVVFRAKSVQAAGLRAANLAIINAIPLFSGPHLGFLADILGVSLSTHRSVHRLAAIMVVLLLMVHCLAAIAGKDSFPLRIAENMWALIVSLHHHHQTCANDFPGSFYVARCADSVSSDPSKAFLRVFSPHALRTRLPFCLFYVATFATRASVPSGVYHRIFGNLLLLCPAPSRTHRIPERRAIFIGNCFSRKWLSDS